MAHFLGDREIPLRGLIGREAFWLALAFAARAGFSLALGERFYQTDEWGYDALARHWVERGVLGGEGSARAVAPLAPAFFGLFYRVGGGVLAVRLAQAALSSLTAWAIGRLTRLVSGSREAGLWALAAAALYPFFVYYAGMLLTETLYVALATAGLWGLCASLKGPRRLASAAGGGAALALAALTRTEGAAAALLIWGAGALVCAAGRWSWRAWLLGVLCWALPLAAWSARNKAACGTYALDAHGGLTLLHGTLLFELNEIDTGVAMEAFAKDPVYREAQALGHVERDRLYYRTALRFMRENPGRTARQAARKFVNFWRLYPRLGKAYPDDARVRPGLGAGRRVLAAVSLASEPALILFGLIGAWRFRREWARLFPLYLFAAATCAVHVVFVSQMRYRLPVAPVLLVFAAAFWAQRREAA